MKKLSSLFLILGTSLSLLGQQAKDNSVLATESNVNTDPSVFVTYSFNAQIHNQTIPNSEVSSYMDSNKNTHIVWIKDDGTATLSVMYTFFDANTHSFTSQEVIAAANSNERLYSPEIVTDASNNKHIVYFKKRDKNAGTNEGNYAVMYAMSSGSTFISSQVSLNPSNPTTSSTGLYNCYVIGRPTIFIHNGTIKVAYQASGNSNTNYDKHMIVATKTGTSTWTHQQAFNTDALTGYFATGSGINVSKIVTGNLYAGIIQNSNYAPWFLSENNNWAETQITGYAGVASSSNKHMQLEQSNAGTTHLFWFNDDNKKYCHTTLSGSSYTTVQEYTPVESPWGNFFSATVDRTLGKATYFYKDASSDCYMVIHNPSTQAFLEIELDKSLMGAIYGKKSLYVDNQYITLVTASQSLDKIFVTTNNALVPSTINVDLLQNKEAHKLVVFPNPSSGIFNVNSEEETTYYLYNIKGELIHSQKSMGNTSFDLHPYPAGNYILKGITNNKKNSSNILIKK